MNKVDLSKASIANSKAELIIVGLYQGDQWPAELNAIDKNNGGLLKKQNKSKSFKASSGSKLSINSANQRILVIGLGKQNEAEGDSVQQFGAKCLSLARSEKVKQCSILFSDLDNKSTSQLCLGIQLADYQFKKYVSKSDKKSPISFSLHHSNKSDSKLKKALTRAKHIAQASAFARDLVNEPPNVLNPIELAKRAQQTIKGPSLKVNILNEKQCLREKMNLFLAVSAGSTRNPPRLIHMSYTPKGKSKRKVFLIGKGVTFDSGGLSIKTRGSMETMKMDMSGSAAVIATMSVIKHFAPNFEVHALVAATENMPDGLSCRPDDIVIGRDGTSVEILNTDAEGRLTLADAITYAKDKGATEIIDLATLTGACVAALGPHTAGLFTNSDKMAEGLLNASEESSEGLWRMPLTKKLKKSIKSPVADLKNIGGSYGGAITAALFLEHFAGKTNWAHLDIAGPAYSGEDSGYIKKGGRGYGVALLLEYLFPLDK